MKFKNTLFYIVLKSVYHSTWKMWRAFFLYRKKYFSNNTVCLIVCDHIGDTLITAGYLQSFRKKLRYKRFKVICDRSLGFLFNDYRGCFDELVTVNTEELHVLLEINKTNLGQELASRFNVVVVNPTNDLTANTFDYIMRYPDISFEKMIKYGILGLPKNAHFMPVSFPIVAPRACTKSIILTPYSKTVKNRYPYVFEEIVTEFAKRGYIIYTNVPMDDDILVKGTLPLTCSLLELVQFAGQCSCIIGMRSGIMDMLAYCRCRMAILYAKTRELDFFSISSLKGTTAEYIELCEEVPTSENKNVMQAIIDFVKKSEKDSI